MLGSCRQTNYRHALGALRRQRGALTVLVYGLPQTKERERIDEMPGHERKQVRLLVESYELKARCVLHQLKPVRRSLQEQLQGHVRSYHWIRLPDYGRLQQK